MILRAHSPAWGLQIKPAGVSGLSGCSCQGLGCGCGCSCDSCKRGMGAWTDDLMAMILQPVDLGFVTLPVWAIGGAALLLVWWLMTPGGSDYRRASKQLRAKYSGRARLSRAARAAAGDLL